MPSHEVHLARLRQQLERAVERAQQEDAGEDRVAALVMQQREVIRDAGVRRGRELHLLVLEADPSLCELYAAVAGAFGIGCDFAVDGEGVEETRQEADHALVLADPNMEEAIAEALEANPRPMLIMTPTVEEVNVALRSPFMERSLGMLIKPFELEPLAFIIAHWTLIRLIADGAWGSETTH